MITHQFIQHWDGLAVCERKDQLAVEEPLEIRLDLQGESSRSLSITMRTPGHDRELAVGFLVTEGLIDNPAQVGLVKSCGPSVGAIGSKNIVRVQLKGASVVHKLQGLKRHFYTTSSCGICGKTSLEAVKVQGPYTAKIRHFTASMRPINKELLTGLPGRLDAIQKAFALTGGIHASGLFSARGEVQAVFEDVGRHNALDKVIGDQFFKNNLPLKNSIVLLSGRASFELVQKAAVAGIPVVASIGAPSSLAVELAREMGQVLVGFLRPDKFNIYAGALS